MQKKSLLVALFCGALCLTGCLKNEESASVEQVRIAKANELNSLATLNAAKAQAEVIYANAEATLKQAQAALLNAQAETEKVRAELLKVQVQFAEVKVEEEKVELQKKQAELEVLLAQYEKEKQDWINKLNNLIAQAQIDAINNAQKILDAEAAVLAANASKAGVAATRYFDALNTVQEYQIKQIAVKAQKVLLETGANTAWKLIDYEIEQIDAEIAENNAIIAALKEKQTMSSEEAEAALTEARIALSEAYTAWKEALEAKDGDTGAVAAYNKLKTKTADFTQGWRADFKDDFQGIVGPSDVYYYGHKSFEELEVPGHSGKVLYAGVYVYDDDDDVDNDVFIPLWTTMPENAKWARSIKDYQRYPDIDVYNDGDFTVLTTTAIAPAKIDFDAVDEVLDDLAEETKDYYAAKVKKYEEKTVPAEIAALNAQKTELEKSLALHKEYVAKRQAEITKAEEAFIAEFKANKGKEEAVETTWEAFQKHMLINHDVDRQLFLTQDKAQKAYDKAVSDANTAASNLAAAKTAASDAETTLKTAKENEAKAEGAYHKAEAENISAETTALNNAIENWNPDYKLEKNDNGTIKAKPKTGTSVKGKDEEGVYQQAYREKFNDLETKKEAEYTAQMNYWRHPDGTYTGDPDYKTLYNNAKAARVTAESDLETAEKNLNDAEGIYNKKKIAYETAAESLTEAKAAWDPAFTPYADATKATEGTNKGKWVIGTVVAGTSQAALLDAEKDLADKEAELKAGTGDKAGKTAFDKDAKAKSDKTEAKTALDNANKALIAAVKGVAVDEVDLTKDKIEDYLDAEGIKLYNAYLTAKKAAGTDTAQKALAKLYAYNPNHIGEYKDTDIDAIWADEGVAQYSWWRSSYSVDYTAKMVDLETAEYYFIATALNGAKMKDGKAVTTKLENGQVIVVPKNFNGSPSYQIAAIEAEIAAKPEAIAEYKAEAAEDLEEDLEDIEEVRANVKAFKAHEAGYTAWLGELAEAEEAVNEAKKVEFDAKKAKDAAQTEYTALKAVADQKIYVYDPGKDIAGPRDADDDNFVVLTIAEEIARREGSIEDLANGVSAFFTAYKFLNNTTATGNEATLMTEVETQLGLLDTYQAKGKGLDSNFELNLAKKVLEKAKQYGKVTVDILVEMLEDEIKQIDEAIDIWTAIANNYKAIVYARLGIVEEGVEVVEEEEA